MQTSTTTAPTHRAILNGSSILIDLMSTEGNEALATFIRDQVAKGADQASLKLEVAGRSILSSGAVATGKLPVPVNNMARSSGPAFPIGIGQYDAEGDARSQVDREAAVAAGFTVKKPIYRQGSRATGMQVHRQAFEALPDAKEAARALIARIARECRADVEVDREDVRLNDRGLLAIGRDRFAFGGRSFQALVTRLGMPPGAGTYLPAIDPKLRATNVNNWVTGPLAEIERNEREGAVMARKVYEPDVLKVRTRLVDPDAIEDDTREAFAVVSDEYGTFDADKIAQAIELAVPNGARAEVDYDGTKCRFNVTFFSNVPVEKAVAGEFFQAGVNVRTDDTGGGSIIVSAAIRQNLCLNFIIIDDASQSVRIRHLGSVEKLAAKFREAFANAMKKIEHFTKTWGYAVADDVVPEALAGAVINQDVTQDDAQAWINRPAREVLAGLFNGIIERELVPLPKRNRPETVGKLLEMYDADDSSARKLSDALVSRAAVVNAITRYAHVVNQDAFKQAELETAGGSILQSTKPLPFLPLPVS